MSNEASGKLFFFPLQLLLGTLCLSMLQLLWSKEASRNMTKFIYDQYRAE